jgi:hypothetical protein
MGSENRDLAEAIRKLSGLEDLTENSFACTVSDIDTTKYTCKCSPIDGSADFLGVKYNANAKKGFVLEPKDGSIVIITVTSETTAFVSMVSEVNQIYLNGDGDGGLIKITDITNELNNRYTVLKNIFSAIAAAADTGISSAGGTPGVVTAYNAISATLTNLNKTAYENNKVKHGSS